VKPQNGSLVSLRTFRCAILTGIHRILDGQQNLGPPEEDRVLPRYLNRKIDVEKSGSDSKTGKEITAH